MVENHYNVLGVSQEATQKDIRKAYTSLALQFHPDKNDDGAARDRFEAIQKAYEVLSDERRRRQYDAQLRGRSCSPDGTTCTVFADGTTGHIITGDGWTFQVNLMNNFTKRFTFRMVEDTDTDMDMDTDTDDDDDEDDENTGEAVEYEFLPSGRVRTRLIQKAKKSSGDKSADKGAEGGAAAKRANAPKQKSPAKKRKAKKYSPDTSSRRTTHKSPRGKSRGKR